MPEMAAWKTWRRGLERVLRRELQRAGVGVDDEQRAIEAVFFDRGTVPACAEPAAFQYVVRPCSEGRYNALRAQALLARRIHLELRKTHIAKPQGSFLERIEQARLLSRAQLIERARQDELREQQQVALSWHLEDLAVVAAMAVVHLRRAGITAEQRSAMEIAQMVIDRVGLDATRRLKRAHWERIAAGIVAAELEKRQRKVRVAVDDVSAPRLRIADVSMDLDMLADEEARASDEAEPSRVRRARVT